MAVYEFDWDCGDVAFKKLRLMMMQMTSQPLLVQAKPFFTFNYEHFMAVGGEVNYLPL